MFIGVQLYSVRDAMGADFEGTLKALHEMGYDSVEFAGLYGRSPAEVKSICAKYGLNPISAHVSIAEMKQNPAVFADYAAIGCRFIVVPYLPEEDRPKNDAELAAMVEMVKDFGKKAKAAGLQLLYHNHDFEFKRMDNGAYMLDALYDAVPADLLQTELDTCWVRVGGEDPAAYVKKYSGRAPIVHLKDYYQNGDNTEGMYELIGISTVKPVAKDESFGFRPVGHGLQDFPPIIDASVAAGASYLIVEQDRPTPGEDMMNEVKKSREYLKSLGY